MQPDELRSVMQFHAAANKAVLDTVANLSDDEFTRETSPSHGTVKDLLVHILGGDIYFLAVCKGETPDMAALQALATFDAIRTRFEQNAAGTDAYLATLSADDLDREVVINFGDEHHFPLKQWQAILQLFSHGHMHRGELSVVLSQLGHPLPTIDLFKHFVIAGGQNWPYE